MATPQPRDAPHPATRTVRIYYVFAAMCACAAPLVATVSPPLVAVISGIPLLASAGLAFWFARFVALNVEVVQVNNRAHDLISRGEVDAAEAMLAPLAARVSRGHLARAVSLQRGAIALHRGDPTAAARHLTAAISARSNLISRRQEQQQIASAYGLRAVAHAMLGERALAEADASAAESVDGRFPDALARARLARAILDAQSDRRAQLAENLSGFGRLYESLSARERSLVRAFERMVRASAGSVYREPAPKVADVDASGLAAWVSKIAPQAASFVGAERVASATGPWTEAPTQAGEEQRKRSAAAATTFKPKRGARLVALWVVLIGLFLAVYQLTTTQPAGTPEAAVVTELSNPVSWIGLLPAAVCALFVAMVAVAIRRGNRADRALARARHLVASGELGAAEEIYRAESKSAAAAAAAAGELGLSRLFEERSDFHAAAVEAQAGVAKAAMVKAVVSDILLPDLHAARAFALAAEGEVDESVAETAALVRDFPSYPYKTTALLRIRLAQALARKDRAAAAAVADERTMEMALLLRDEILCDLLAAWSHGAPDEERARLLSAVRASPDLGRWIDALAPGLVSDVERKVRVSAAAAVAGDAEVAHAEAAYAEAAHAEAAHAEAADEDAPADEAAAARAQRRP